MSKRTQKSLDELIARGKPVAGVSFGDGLTFTSSAAQIVCGAGTWVFRYRHVGRQRERTLSNYPDMPLERSKSHPAELKSAREVARAMRVMVDLGKDVAGEKRRAKAEAAAARTFREVGEEHFENQVKATRAALTVKEWRRYLDRDILPKIGGIAMREVIADDVISTIESVGRRGSKAAARRVFDIISLIFSYAMAKRAAPHNPCIGLKASAIIGEHQKRARLKLDRDELVKLLTSAAPALGRLNELTIRILLATCVRKGELLRAKKTDLDLDAGLWTVPDQNSKMGKGYIVPLAPVVVGWFRELISHSGDSQWVLPARQGYGRRKNIDQHVGLRTINKALESVEEFGIRAFTPHDLRSTARSHLAALGVDVIVAERCLNHSLGGLVAVYDQHDYLDERRDALEKWANLLNELQHPSNVVALRPAA